MIFDSIENASKYFILGEKIKKGFDFLLNTDLENLKPDRYEIENDEIFANVQILTTKNKEDKKWEAHRKYIDIQYLIKGRECMGYGLLKNFKTSVEYDDKNDIEFLSGDKFNYINLSKGEFVIFYPDDIHAPVLNADENKEIKKVIVKIKI